MSLGRISSNAITFAFIFFLARPLAAKESPPFTTRDAFCGPGEDCVALSPIKKWTEAQWYIFQTFELTPTAQTVVRITSDAFQALSLDQLIASQFALVLPDQTRIYSFTGTSDSDKYSVYYRKSLVREFPLRKFLDGGLQFGIQLNDGIKDRYGRGYRLSWEGSILTDELTHKTQLELSQRQLKVLDPKNLSKISPPTGELFPGNSGFSRKVLDDISSTFGGFMNFVSKFGSINSNIDVVENTGQPYTKVSIRAKLKVENIKSNYPNLGIYLARMMQFLGLKLNSILFTKDGLKLWTLSYDSGEHAISMSFNTVEGALVPEDESGTPALSKKLFLSTVQEFTGHMKSTAHISVYGLRIISRDTQFAVNYKDGQIAELTWRLTKMPVPTFKGALFGIMPPGLIDLMMPGNLREYSRMFAHGLVKGNEGRGTFGSLRIDSKVENKTIAHATTSMELKDNFYLNIGLRVVNDYLWPSPETAEDSRKFFADGLGHLISDFQSLQKDRKI